MNPITLWTAIGEARQRRNAWTVLALTILGIAVVWALTVFLVIDKRQSLLEEKRQVLGRLGSAVTAQVHQYVRSIEILLDSADHWCSKNPDLDPRFDEDFNLWVASFYQTTHDQIDIRLYDENGGVYFPLVKSVTPLANLAQSDFFMAANAQAGLFIGLPFVTPLLKRLVIPLSFPLQAKPHGISVIAAEITLKTLEDLFESARDQPNGSITLLRRDGTVMARSPRMDGMIGKSIATGALISTLINQKKSGTVVKVGDIDGKSRLISYESMPDYPLIAVMTADMDDILFPSYEYAAFAGLIAFALSLFMIVMAIQALAYLRLVADTHQKLSAEAATDALTGIANRRYLLRFATNEILRSNRYSRPFSLLMLDLDRFKEVNDRYGHLWGDEVLKHAAAATQTVLRITDLLGRYGGEEFVVLMPETSVEEAVNVAERIREAIGKISIDTGNGEITIKASIGVAPLLPAETDLQSLINRADAALYSAKRAGRDRVVNFDESH